MRRTDDRLTADYGQNADPCSTNDYYSACPQMQAVCSGPVVGQGTTQETYDIGLGIRCNMPDGTPSNIVVVYNHLEPIALPSYVDTNHDGAADTWQANPFPGIGRHFKRGQPLGVRADPHNDNPNPFTPHLHLEVFYVVNDSDYRKGGSENTIRLNPALFFSASVQEQIIKDIGNYYPIDAKTSSVGQIRFEWPPFDTIDPIYRLDIGMTEEAAKTQQDTDLRILPEHNHRFTAPADHRGATVAQIWKRTDQSGIQDIIDADVEWSPVMIMTMNDLIEAMEEWIDDNR